LFQTLTRSPIGAATNRLAVLDASRDLFSKYGVDKSGDRRDRGAGLAVDLDGLRLFKWLAATLVSALVSTPERR
jgi:hypothetical protein